MSAATTPAGERSLRGLRILITGATAGLGRVAAIELGRRGAHLMLAGRDPGRTEAARAAVAVAASAAGGPAPETLAVDLGAQASIRSAAAEVRTRWERIDILISNAGVYSPQRKVTVDGLEETFAVNVVAPFLMTELLLPALQAAAPARAITTSSNRHRGGKLHWDDLQLERGHGGIAAYNQSKLAVNLLVREAARRHAGSGVSFQAVHPGAIATEIYRDLPWIVRKLIPVFTRTAAGGAAPLVHVATLPELPPSGTYWNRLRPETASAAARDDAAAARLWDLVKGLAGL